MSKCICINTDKEEYLNFGELPSDSYRDTKACNTVEYLLGTEWADDRIIFAFEGMIENDMCPEIDEDLYSYAIRNYDERCVLGDAPKFRYVLNQSKNTYFDKLKIPEGDDGTYFDPISLLLSASKNQSSIGMGITGDERKEIGIWCGDRLRAVNNITSFPGFICIVPSFKNESGLTGKLDGMNLVITGTLRNCIRDEAETMIIKAGGKLQSGITRRTDYLVVGANPGTVKLNKAKDYGIKEISEDEFFDMLN